MEYRKNPKNGDEISLLGYGCMRFPRKGGKTDQEKVNELISAALDNGINYFDTAYIYPGNETALGRALAFTGKREQVRIATKLPHYMCKKPGDFDKYFDAHLERLQTDYIDYYLIHMLSNTESWERLRALDIEAWIAKKRSEGKIRNLGFSFHGGRKAFVDLLDAYDWEFCMIQYNYLDEHNQAGYSGVQKAHEKGLPVFVMEPLRGGMLANNMLAKDVFKKADKERSPAEWGLRWVFNHPEVTMVLSGMSDMSQLTENIAVASSAAPNHLTENELSVYKDVVAALNKAIKVPCTACGYCMPCPKGVDIPACFASFNESYSTGLIGGMTQYFQVTGMTTPVQSDASLCVGCGKCASHCPQSIQIPKELARVNRRMKAFLINPVMRLTRRILRIK